MSEEVKFITTSGSLYDTHRPSYPTSSVSSLLTAMHLAGAEGHGARVLELGAGTGKFTELLAARDEGFEVLAAEPYGEMRQSLERKGLKGVRVLDAGAEKVDGVENESCDGVVVAQAFHWFANRESLEEIYRVLIPGGVLGLIWNVEDAVLPLEWEPQTSYGARLRSIVYSPPYEDGSPRQFRKLRWREVFEEDQLKSTPLTIQKADPLFSLPLGEARERWVRWETKEEIWRNWETKSQVARLDQEGKEKMKKRVEEVLDADDVERNDKGQIAIHGRTYWVWTSKIPGHPLKEGG